MLNRSLNKIKQMGIYNQADLSSVGRAEDCSWLKPTVNPQVAGSNPAGRSYFSILSFYFVIFVVQSLFQIFGFIIISKDRRFDQENKFFSSLAANQARQSNNAKSKYNTTSSKIVSFYRQLLRSTKKNKNGKNTEFYLSLDFTLFGCLESNQKLNNDLYLSYGCQ